MIRRRDSRSAADLPTFPATHWMVAPPRPRIGEPHAEPHAEPQRKLASMRARDEMTTRRVSIETCGDSGAQAGTDDRCAHAMKFSSRDAAVAIVLQEGVRPIRSTRRPRICPCR
jgi:hypothetical protein